MSIKTDPSCSFRSEAHHWLKVPRSMLRVPIIRGNQQIFHRPPGHGGKDLNVLSCQICQIHGRDVLVGHQLMAIRNCKERLDPQQQSHHAATQQIHNPLRWQRLPQQEEAKEILQVRAGALFLPESRRKPNVEKCRKCMEMYGPSSFM